MENANLQDAPKMRLEIGSKVAPGDRLCSASQVRPGAGTYIRGGHMFASAVGKLVVTSLNDGRDPSHVASVELEQGRLYASAQILAVGQTVLGKVVRIMMQQATVEIVAADQLGSLKEHHGGIIRKEDVRIGVSEEVQIYESFRPGDIVLAKIISLGDSRRYYLSTADNDLGVIRAICSKSGEAMTPISWREMECPSTKIREPRKCAKPKDSDNPKTSDDFTK